MKHLPSVILDRRYFLLVLRNDIELKCQPLLLDNAISSNLTAFYSRREKTLHVKYALDRSDTTEHTKECAVTVVFFGE